MDEFFRLVAAGGDLGTLVIVYVYVKHSSMLSELKAKIELIERALFMA